MVIRPAQIISFIVQALTEISFTGQWSSGKNFKGH